MNGGGVTPRPTPPTPVPPALGYRVVNGENYVCDAEGDIAWIDTGDQQVLKQVGNKWVPTPTIPQVPVMDDAIAEFSGIPESFTHAGYTFDWQQGETDGYIVTPALLEVTPQVTLYTVKLIVGGEERECICDAEGVLHTINVDGTSLMLKYIRTDNEVGMGALEQIPAGYPVNETNLAVVNEGDDFSVGQYQFTWNSNNDDWFINTAPTVLQRPLYSHEYTYGNFISNGERDQSSNMKAAYITVGGTVQLFKENTTAGKWVTVPNDNNLALMDAPLTTFVSGPPSDFTYQGFTFTFSAGDVDGYIVAPTLSII